MYEFAYKRGSANPATAHHKPSAATNETAVATAHIAVYGVRGVSLVLESEVSRSNIDKRTKPLFASVSWTSLPMRSFVRAKST